MLNILLQITSGVADTANKAAQAVTTAPPPVDLNKAAQKATEVSVPLGDLALKGGWIMIPLLIFLLIALFFAVERLMAISKASKFNRTLILSIRDSIMNGQLESARNQCRALNSPQGRMIESGINAIGRKTDEIEKEMEKTGRQEIGKLERNMSIISLIARLAPMFGFVGTIFGVIKIFFNIALQDNISISVISSGLYEKMVTSAGGLIVGLIAFACYHMLNSWIDRISHRLEGSSMEFMKLMHEPAK
jgi:biopolymer transport protein ExbB